MTPQSKRTLIFFIIILAIVFAFIYHNKGFPWMNGQSSSSANSPSVQDNVKSAMLSAAKLNFAGVSSEQLVTEWPKDLSFLQLPEISNTKIENVKYQNGKSGFDISFNLGYALDSAYNVYNTAVTQTAGWAKLFGARSDTFGIVEATNKNYQIRVTIDLVNQSSVDINIKASTI